MISTIIGLVISLLRAANLLLVIYCAMTIFMPQNDILRKASEYVEPILMPFRRVIYRIFPKMHGLAIDFSPILVWLAIDVLIWALQFLRRLLF